MVIATQYHLKLLEEKLHQANYDPFKLRLLEKLITEDAQDTLSKFMIGTKLDEILFRHVIGGVLARARKNKRPVRAFGEMVVLLLAKGLPDTTLQLEHLWNDLKQSEAFSLFCAYPRSVFSKNSEAILNVCGAHSKIVAPVDASAKNVLYKDLSFNTNN